MLGTRILSGLLELSRVTLFSECVSSNASVSGWT